MSALNRAERDVVQIILNTRAVTPEQVLEMRRVVWPDGHICRREAEVLFEINDTLEHSCGEWGDFFAGVMVAHLVEQASPRGYVSEEDAQWFASRVLHDDEIRDATELETLIQLLEKAMTVPPALEMLALRAVRRAVLTGDDAALGTVGKPRAGVMDDVAVAALRRILYAKASGESEGVSRDEAELLFELNDATVDAQNCEAWQPLFVNAVANFLLVASGYEPPSRERMREIDLWMNAESRGVAGFIREALRGGREADAEAPDRLEDYYARRVTWAAAERAVAERIEADEASWLIRRLNRDGVLSPNERALLNFIEAGGFEVDPTLERDLMRA